MAQILVIVESPAKAKTLARFLGSGYTVEASIGHVRDLPDSASEIPAKYKKEAWARLGVDTEHGFKPLYVISSEKKAQIKKLRQQLAGASALYLATDEDREGESISWHLREILKPSVPTKRLVFHEITKGAIQDALEHTRDINEDLVKAQEARRVVDRLYGYAVSPLLWKKIKPRLSAGRVQSVAVRLVVERERSRMAFRAAVYWDLSATMRKDGKSFDATLTKLGGKRIAIGRDFDPTTGKLSDAEGAAPLLVGAEDAARLAGELEGREARVSSLEDKPFTERPSAPFTTSTLQQEANAKLRFSARRTMDLAQRLYEHGFITYMRTDSTTLSGEALQAARALVSDRFTDALLPDGPRHYKSKVKNAQEAHEAIRPAGPSFTEPAVVADSLGRDAARVYDLIWRRTVASQMVDAKGHRVSVEIEVGEAVFQASGKVYHALGFLEAYADAKASSSRVGKGSETHLPELAVGDRVETTALEACEHRTQPPARLTEASLVRELESRGIGRPSTYAAIIDTILRRAYVRKKGSALVPTYTAFAVVRLLEDHLSYLIDYGFTAKMEDELDTISLGDLTSGEYLSRFYHGNGHAGLKRTLEEVESKIDPRVVCGIPLGEAEGGHVEVRVGRYGPFLSQGELRASVPEDIAPDELDLERALLMLAEAAKGPRVVGVHAETGQSVYAKTGRFGPYVQLGDVEEGSKEKPKMASLLAGMDPDTITLDEAVGLLSMPRLLGEASGKLAGTEVFAANGRYGPYVYAGKETRSLPADLSPLVVTLEQALELLSKPKERRRRAAREPLKDFGTDERSGRHVRLLDGRFGPYVTDGTTNASLPRGTTVEEVTLDFAIEVLIAREKAGPKKKRTKRAAKKAGGSRKAGRSSKSASTARGTKKKTKRKAAKKKPASGKPKR